MTAQATVQAGWRTVLARVFARDVTLAYSDWARFKIGVGGHTAGTPNIPTGLELDVESEGAAQTGTVSFSTASAIVSGSGTAFLADFAVGDWIKPSALPAAPPIVNSAGMPGSEEDVWGQVLTVDSNTQITLTAAYTGGTYPLSDARVPMKASTPMFAFRKALADADVVFFSAVPAITEVTAVVGSLEANADQLGNSPAFYELGIFDGNGVMVVYETFDQQIKVSGVQLNHIIQVSE